MKNAQLAIFIAFIMGGVLGWIGTNTITDSQLGGNLPSRGIGGAPAPEGDVNAAVNSKAANLRLQLNDLLKEHTVLTSTHLQEVFDGKNISTTKTVLDDNSQNIAGTIGSVYGGDVQNNFLKMWNNHLDQYKNYTLALKNNDTSGKNQLRNDLIQTSKTMEQLLNQLDSNILANEISNLMSTHIDLTLSIIEEYANKNDEQRVNTMKQAYDQAGQLADSLTQFILNTKPEMFQ